MYFFLFYFHGSVFYIGFYFYFCYYFGLGLDYMVWDYYCTIPLPLNPLCPSPIGDFSLFMRGGVSEVRPKPVVRSLLWIRTHFLFQTFGLSARRENPKTQNPYVANRGARLAHLTPLRSHSFFHEPCKVLSSFSLFNGL